MELYAFTPREYEQLKTLVREAEGFYKSIIQEGYKSGAEQDGHHDEGFQKGLDNAMVQSKRIRELQELMTNVKIVTPEEQNNSVKIGNGVVVEYEDGSVFSFILEGYVVSENNNQLVSVYSPMGKSILGAKVGEERVIKLPRGSSRVTIREIIPPSHAS